MSTETPPVAAGGAGPGPPGGEDPFRRERQVYEPHRVGLPPLIPYLREVWRRREFARELARSNLRAQHFNTVFGQLWLIINPLLLAGVYFVLVDILRRDARGAEFLGHLIACLFAYYFVAQSVRKGVKSVTSGGRLILNSAFPRLLLPLSSVVTAFLRFLPTAIIYVPVHLIIGLPITWNLLWVVPITALLIGLALGLTVIAATAQVYFRDLSSFLPYALRMWLYMSPILYYADEAERYQPLLAINPLAPLLSAWSDALTRGRAPDTTDLLIGCAWVGVLVVAGVLVFMSREREFAVRL